jgi:hypothetical protein
MLVPDGRHDGPSHARGSSHARRGRSSTRGSRAAHVGGPRGAPRAGDAVAAIGRLRPITIALHGLRHAFTTTARLWRPRHRAPRRSCVERQPNKPVRWRARAAGARGGGEGVSNRSRRCSSPRRRVCCCSPQRRPRHSQSYGGTRLTDDAPLVAHCSKTTKAGRTVSAVRSSNCPSWARTRTLLIQSQRVRG